MKERIAFSLGCFVMVVLLCACQQIEGETLALLDEPIAEIRVTESSGIEITDEEDAETLYIFSDSEDIAVLEKALKTAVLNEELIPPADPEYHLYVHYDKNLPVHAFHLWLGKDEDESLLMYMIDESQSMYVVSAEMSKQLRVLFK